MGLPLISACDTNQTHAIEDLKRYVEEIKNRPPAKVVPLPVTDRVTPYLISKTDLGEDNPFIPLHLE